MTCSLSDFPYLKKKKEKIGAAESATVQLHLICVHSGFLYANHFAECIYK